MQAVDAVCVIGGRPQRRQSKPQLTTRRGLAFPWHCSGEHVVGMSWEWHCRSTHERGWGSRGWGGQVAVLLLTPSGSGQGRGRG